jgi:HEAT repeat protein
VLINLLKSSDPWLRKYAAELLAYIGDERALDALRDAAINDEKSAVRRYAKKAYKEISGEKL